MLIGGGRTDGIICRQASKTSTGTTFAQNEAYPHPEIIKDTVTTGSGQQRITMLSRNLLASFLMDGLSGHNPLADGILPALLFGPLG